MLKKKQTQLHSYGFRFLDVDSELPVQLRSIGWEIHTDPTYSWDGRTRNDVDTCLFQYTLSGEGRLDIGGVVHKIRPGEAFLVNIPGNHHYYFSEQETHWEFIFILFWGYNALTQWEKLQNQWGNIVKLDIESPVIQRLKQIYYEAAGKNIKDQYIASNLVYSFVMETFRAAQGPIHVRPDQIPASIVTAIEYSEEYFDQNIGLDDLADEAGLSKYHFSRLFRKSVGMTPVQYINKIRLEKAVQLLNQTDLTVEEIGRNVGFSNGNYFCKVFKKLVGTSPEKFRSGNDMFSVDDWTLR